MISTTAHLDEDPFKELHCLSYLTDRITGRKEGLEVIQGDVSRVLPMIECLEDSEHYYLIMPLLNTDLYDIVKNCGAFAEERAFAVLSDILAGLEVAHSLGLAHHDISLENLMLDSSGHVVK